MVERPKELFGTKINNNDFTLSGDGYNVRLRKDWTKAPDILDLDPSRIRGRCTRLNWDKCNNENRLLEEICFPFFNIAFQALIHQRTIVCDAHQDDFCLVLFSEYHIIHN